MMKINPLLKNFLIVVAILIAVGAFFSLFSLTQMKPTEESLTQLASDINQDKVKKITISGDDLDVIYRDNSSFVSMKETGTSLADTLTNLGSAKENLQKVQIEVKPAKQDLWSWLTPLIVFGILPLVVFGFFFWTML